MSPTQVHLVLNHVPVIGTAFVIAALAAGLLFRSGALVRFGLAMLVCVALAAIPVLLTGEPAEERVEHLAGVSKSTVEDHEQAARPATFALGGLGLLALVGLARTWRRPPSRALAGGMLALTLLMGAGLAWTAHLGGLIRHPEMSSGSVAAAPSADAGHDVGHEDERDAHPEGGKP